MNKDGEDKKPIRVWLVVHTLTSGEVHTFYVKAKDHYQAYEIGGEWAEIMETVPSLQGFKMRY